MIGLIFKLQNITSTSSTINIQYTDAFCDGAYKLRALDLVIYAIWGYGCGRVSWEQPYLPTQVYEYIQNITSTSSTTNIRYIDGFCDGAYKLRALDLVIYAIWGYGCGRMGGNSHIYQHKSMNTSNTSL